MRPTRTPLASTTGVPRSSSSFTSFFFDVLMSERQPPDQAFIEPVFPGEGVGLHAVDVDADVDSGPGHLRPRNAKDGILADAEVARQKGHEAFPTRAEAAGQNQRARFEMRDPRLRSVRDVKCDAVDLAE